MKPNEQWLEDWRIGVNSLIEGKISRDLLKIYDEFWKSQGLDEKSKTTKNRYANALHALGGYLVEQATHSDDMKKTAHDLLLAQIRPYEGPLVHHDNENWQNELDMVCRKLYKHIKKNR